ncbi:MAG: hypothetical protein ACE5F1_18235, partial [Planctomycetota bacterium]
LPRRTVKRPKAREKRLVGDLDQRWSVLEKHLLDRLQGGEDCPAVSPMSYRSLVGVSRRTASRDLSEWLSRGLLESEGQKRSMRYLFPVERLEQAGRESSDHAPQSVGS